MNAYKSAKVFFNQRMLRRATSTSSRLDLTQCYHSLPYKANKLHSLRLNGGNCFYPTNPINLTALPLADFYAQRFRF